MKKRIIVLSASILLIITILVGCSQADKVSQNLSTEADNFNVVRQLTVVNCIQNDVIFQMTGKMSIKADIADNQLEIIVEDENGNYQKNFVGLSDNVTYTIQQMDYKNVENFKYTINFNPKMWLPVEIDTIE